MTDSLSTIRHLIDPSEPLATEIYRCPKGNVWELVRVRGEDRSMVRCTPGTGAGQPPTLVSVEEFLAVQSAGPEHAALRILLTATGSAETTL